MVAVHKTGNTLPTGLEFGLGCGSTKMPRLWRYFISHPGWHAWFQGWHGPRKRFSFGRSIGRTVVGEGAGVANQATPGTGGRRRLLLVCKVQPVTDGVQVTMVSLLVSTMVNNSKLLGIVKTWILSWPDKMASFRPNSTLSVTMLVMPLLVVAVPSGMKDASGTAGNCCC